MFTLACGPTLHSASSSTIAVNPLKMPAICAERKLSRQTPITKNQKQKQLPGLWSGPLSPLMTSHQEGKKKQKNKKESTL